MDDHTLCIKIENINQSQFVQVFGRERYFLSNNSLLYGLPPSAGGKNVDFPINFVRGVNKKSNIGRDQLAKCSHVCRFWSAMSYVATDRWNKITSDAFYNDEQWCSFNQA